MMPVIETPKRRSSDVLETHFLEMKLKSVRVDWNVPRIVAIRVFLASSSSVSVERITISDRLQNSLSLRIISEQGLHPASNSGSLYRIPFSLAKWAFLNSLERVMTFFAAYLEKIPRSPDFESYNDFHSVIKVSMVGCLSLYTAELFESERCGFKVHHCPVLAFRILSSDRLDNDNRAERLTPPTTIVSAT